MTTITRQLLTSALLTACVSLATGTALSDESSLHDGTVSGGGALAASEVACEFPFDGTRFYQFEHQALPGLIADREPAAFLFGSSQGVEFVDDLNPVRRFLAGGRGKIQYTAGEESLTVTIDLDRLATRAEIATMINVPRLYERTSCYHKARADFPRRGIAGLEGWCALATTAGCHQP